MVNDKYHAYVCQTLLQSTMTSFQPWLPILTHKPELHEVFTAKLCLFAQPFISLSIRALHIHFRSLYKFLPLVTNQVGKSQTGSAVSEESRERCNKYLSVGFQKEGDAFEKTSLKGKSCPSWSTILIGYQSSMVLALKKVDAEHHTTFCCMNCAKKWSGPVGQLCSTMSKGRY